MVPISPLSLLWAIAFSTLTPWIAWNLLRRYTISTFTVLNDLDRLGQYSGAKNRDTAIVAGGSVSGLLAARVLSDYFEKVVIIEPDLRLLPRSPRVGQRMQLHVFNAISLSILRKLFVDFDRVVQNAGGIIHSGGWRWHIGRFPISITPERSAETLNISRLTFERVLQCLVTAYASVEIIQGTVVGVKPSEDGSRIQSVSFRTSTVEAGDKSFYESTSTKPSKACLHTVPCAFFADCSGPSAIGSKILPTASGASWGPYTRHHYDPMMNYRTAVIEVPEHIQEAVSRSVPPNDLDYGRWNRMTIIHALAPTSDRGKAGYVLQKVDDNRILAMHAGFGLDHLANNFAEYEEIVRNIHLENFGVDTPEAKRMEWVFDFLNVLRDKIDAIDDAVEFVPYKMGPCQWIDFRSAAMPANFVAIGDANMRLNPILGQGITKALCDATFLYSSLNRLLTPSPTEDVPSGFSSYYFKRALPLSLGFYHTNRMMDYGYDSTIPQVGETLNHGKWFRMYYEGLLGLTKTDSQVVYAINGVLGGLAPGIDLVNPFISFRVLKQGLRSRH